MLFMSISLVLLVQGCQISNAPEQYTPPTLDVSAAYNNISTPAADVANVAWWELFKDPQLIALINQGLADNSSIKNSLSRIKIAQYQLAMARSTLYPTVNYAISAKNSRNSTTTNVTNSVIAGANVSYTLDLWHQLENQNTAALNGHLAMEMAAEQVTATLVSQIATLYFNLCDIDNKVIILNDMNQSLTRYRDIINSKYQGGFVSKVNLNQANVELKETEIFALSLRYARAQLVHGLSVLIGKPPGNVTDVWPLRAQLSMAEFPIGVPSNLLQRRPDILTVDRKLRAQLAQIGATKALKYPNFTISLNAGLSLLESSLMATELAANLIGPIFNHGKIDNAIKIEQQKYQQLVDEYEKTYLVALQEVEDSLVAIDTYRQQFRLRNQQLKLAEEALGLAWVRYNEGVSSFLEFINLHNDFLNAQLKASENYTLQLQSMVKLYLALGGGWNIQPQSPPVNRSNNNQRKHNEQ